MIATEPPEFDLRRGTYGQNSNGALEQWIVFSIDGVVVFDHRFLYWRDAEAVADALKEIISAARMRGLAR